MARSFSIQIFLESFCFPKKYHFSMAIISTILKERKNFANLKDPFIKKNLIRSRKKESKTVLKIFDNFFFCSFFLHLQDNY